MTRELWKRVGRLGLFLSSIAVMLLLGLDLDVLLVISKLLVGV